MSSIPFIDLQAQQARIRPEIDRRIQDVLNHGKYIMGPEVAELESRLADYVGVQHCIGVASGTDALLMALMAYGVGPGDAVFTTPFTFVATAEVISLLGATPVFVDIDPQTFNICPKSLEQAIAKARAENRGQLIPRGIVPVDLFGLPADYDAINALAKTHGLFVLEDSAQGLGGVYKGRMACSLAHSAATSFFPAKPLGCYGDGGAIFTSDDEFAEKLRSIRVHGKGSNKYDNIRIGVNGRLDTLQAAILLPKFDIFPEEIDKRNAVAEGYSKRLSQVPGLRLPIMPEGYRSAWAQYSLLTERREELQASLKAVGVPTAVYYPKPLHLQTAYGGLGSGEGAFPESEKAAQSIMSLPMHPYLQEEQIAFICDTIRESLR
ncbi:aminotransferase DegT [Syntrophotalea acetylenivorans]|uniref:Aminotransferase DegT n=1 Tax=Syntrophotalea acetylenivorans TaxID=1842532 RepID=A0A1L3GL28_9BACT|nr:DegT/DnrJ/EryC1/StrS aminotransferase family protein [Syntrophotalea acetylenivorans]APG26646.1 aminotransferase DegT [Syntrophotalea acetylenivorans]